MFTREKKQKNKDGTIRTYLQVIEAYRENGKPKQRTVATLGRIGEEITGKKVDQLMKSLEKHADKVKILNLLKDKKEKASREYGQIQIYRKVFKDLGHQKLLQKKLADTEKEINYVEAMFMAICNRLMNPGSKKKISEWKRKVYEPEWEQLELQHIYRGMDFLVEQKDEIEEELFDRTRTLFNCKVNVAMFDTTTVSYWGKGKASIFQRGNAKNKRFDLKQVVVGIIMDQDGTPLGHEVWPGNMSDKPAFKEVIKKIKRRFCIEKVILVCDRGMISEDNIAFLEEEKYEYILGVKMRQLSEIRQRLLLNDEGFRDIYVGERMGKEMLEGELWEKELIEQRELKIAKGKNPRPLNNEKIKAYKESIKGQRRWAVCLNTILAKEDKEKREYFQQILENKVEYRTAKEWIVKNGYKKYVKIKKLTIELDYEKLNAEEFYDGKWALITNTSLPITSLVRCYKELCAIEQHFRTLKSEIKLGPIRHWTENRVRAHVFICFLSLQIRAYITKKLKNIDPDLSYNQVMDDVSEIKVHISQIKDQIIAQRTEFIGKAYLAFKATGAKIPPDILSINKFESQKKCNAYVS